MRKLGMGFLLFLGACSSTRITYEIGEEIKSPPSVTKEAVKPQQTLATSSSGEREPDIRSVPATVTFDYPERVNPALYKVISPVNVRDFPSAREGKIVGMLRPGETVVGNEIEGAWIRIYTNSYTSLKSLKRIDQ